jgi:hypothetical protein
MDTPNLNKAIEGLIRYTVSEAQKELSKSRTINGRQVKRVASGKLKRSLFGTAYQKAGLVNIVFDSKVNYGKYIEYGVNGTERKYGSPFSYSGENVNTNWVTSWAKKKGIKGEANINSLKYVIGRSLARNGIAPVPYFQLGLETAIKKLDDNIFKAYFKDIDLEINKQLK